ncbi:MAG: pro-sigmaK processing inhibitor BofA family protein [Bacilli bacterium]|nr:pro-sigmaK processing inhibitor BofA family protein [Bacilli bacterium]
MKRKLLLFLKKVVMSFLLLYGLNYFLSSLQIAIPINLITITIVSFLGIPGLSSLIILFFIVK